MAQSNLDLGVLQDTKLTYGVYTHELAGYSVVYMGALFRHCSGVELFFHVPPQLSIKALQQFGTNVVRIQLIKGEQQWYMIVC